MKVKIKILNVAHRLNMPLFCLLPSLFPLPSPAFLCAPAMRDIFEFLQSGHHIFFLPQDLCVCFSISLEFSSHFPNLYFWVRLIVKSSGSVYSPPRLFCTSPLLHVPRWILTVTCSVCFPTRLGSPEDRVVLDLFTTFSTQYRALHTPRTELPFRVSRMKTSSSELVHSL